MGKYEINSYSDLLDLDIGDVVRGHELIMRTAWFGPEFRIDTCWWPPLVELTDEDKKDAADE